MNMAISKLKGDAVSTAHLFKSDAAIVSLSKVGMTYDSDEAVLSAIDLKIHEGEFFSLIGPSGCGKSTLLKIIAHITQPTSGKVNWWGSGADVLGSKGKKIAFVFQDPTLMPWANVEENVRLPLELAGVPRNETKVQVVDALQSVGLLDQAKRYPRHLSGGMKMRVSIARALVTKPNLLLMDEPFGALDEFTRNKLDTDLSNLCRERRMTTVFVTHSIYEAAFLSNRVAVMASAPGRIFKTFKIDAPSMRNDNFRLQNSFMEMCKTLSTALVDASLGAER